MKLQAPENGFVHYVLAGAVLVLAIAGTFVLVLQAHHHGSTSVNLNITSKHAQNQNTLNANSQTQSGLTTTTTTSSSTSSGSSSTAKSSPAKTATSTSSTTTSSSVSEPNQNAGNPPQTQTTLSCLTAVITSLDNGGSANVTASTVTVAGPITDATGRPLVFTCNGTTYFAYTQETKPNFNTSASQTAGTMAITAENGSPSLTQAHLDKSGELVDADETLVGYSTGGD